MWLPSDINKFKRELCEFSIVKLKQNGIHFAGNIIKPIFLYENVGIWFKYHWNL